MADAGGCAALHTEFTDDVIDGLCGAILKTEKKCVHSTVILSFASFYLTFSMLVRLVRGIFQQIYHCCIL
jgi:hypothetical protein